MVVMIIDNGLQNRITPYCTLFGELSRLSRLPAPSLSRTMGHRRQKNRHEGVRFQAASGCTDPRSELPMALCSLRLVAIAVCCWECNGLYPLRVDRWTVEVLVVR